MMRAMLRATIVGASLFLSATAAYAQAIEVAEIETPAHETGFFARAGYGHRYDADIDGPSDFATDDVRGELGGTIAFNERVRWLNFVGYGYNNYDAEFVDAHVHNLTLASIVGWTVHPQWNLLFGPMVSFYAEEGASWGDAVSAGGALGFTYTATPNLSIGLALLTLKRFEAGFSLLPIVMTDWRFAPNWQLYTGMTEVAARRGVGGYVAWDFLDPCQLSFGVQYEHRRFRLDDGHLAPDFIAEDRSVPVYARFTVRIVEGLSADVLAGVAFAGEIKLNDADDHFVADADYDVAPLMGVRIQYVFRGI